MSKPNTSNLAPEQVEKFKQLLVSGTSTDWLRLTAKEREMFEQYKAALVA